MYFIRDYDRNKRKLRVIYIEYSDNKPFAVIAENDGYNSYFDFEQDCNDETSFMYYHSGGGGSMKELQAPHFIEGANTSYWIHKDAAFKDNELPINCMKLETPIRVNGCLNPFQKAREVLGIAYCKICDKHYDEEYCQEHHIETEDGMCYEDGTSIYE